MVCDDLFLFKLYGRSKVLLRFENWYHVCFVMFDVQNKTRKRRRKMAIRTWINVVFHCIVMKQVNKLCFLKRF